MDNSIELKPVKDLLGMNFFIPEYQRGYRWKTRQVLDLLEDIQDFIKNTPGGMYCLQPLVVKKGEPLNEENLLENVKRAQNIQEVKNLLAEKWEVVDGQQRLTTLYILIKYLNNVPFYQIDYATRDKSRDFLNKIGTTDKKEEAQHYIDFLHMQNTYEEINKWFKGKSDEEKNSFLNAIINRTEFIWYDCAENAIEVFTRLNIGKISLTNSELVKALFLNSSHFASNQIRQNEIAVLWDRMEYALQKDEFWCFIHEDGYEQPTRIDFILELLVKLKNEERNGKGKKKQTNDSKDDFNWKVNERDLGGDHYRTFRYFYHLFKNNKDKDNIVNKIWDEVKRVFDELVEWYNDNECYHYIGFLEHYYERKGKPFDFKTLIEEWRKSDNKDSFKNEILIKRIKDILNDKEISDLDKQYEMDKNSSKTLCYPLLLLFNIQSIVDKNNKFKKDGKFDALDFERFPFNLFKKEKGWDIEHIAPNTESSFPTENDRLQFLEYVKQSKVISDGLIENVESYINEHKSVDDRDKKTDADSTFNKIRKEIEEGTLDDKERNKVWNFCLLDQSTNRSYGNSIFALKRKEILLRERGLDINEQPLVNDENDKTKKRRVFIPICTLNAFTKFYNTDTKDLSVWGMEDAEAYRKAIYLTLKDFDVKYKDCQTI